MQPTTDSCRGSNFDIVRSSFLWATVVVIALLIAGCSGAGLGPPAAPAEQPDDTSKPQQPVTPEPQEPDEPDEPGEPAAPEPSGDLVLKPNFRVLQDSELASVAPDSVRFAEPTGYQVGDVISIGITDLTPEGLLRKVTGVSADRMVLQTSQATLEDAIQSGELVFGGFLQEPSTGGIQAASDDKPMVFPITAASAGISASAELTISLYPEARFELDKDKGIKSARLTVTPTVRFTANATADGKFKASKDLVDKKMAPLPSNVPSLILTPKLSISFEITGEIVAKAEAEYSYSTTWGTECVSPCDSLSDWRQVSTGAKANGDGSITSESFVGGSLKASIPSRLSVEASWMLPMFNFASMFLELTPFVTGTAVKEESWPFCLLAKVESGLDGELGVDALGLEGPSFAGQVLKPSTLWENRIGACHLVPSRPTVTGVRIEMLRDSRGYSYVPRIFRHTVTWSPPASPAPILFYEIGRWSGYSRTSATPWQYVTRTTAARYSYDTEHVDDRWDFLVARAYNQYGPGAPGSIGIGDCQTDAQCNSIGPGDARYRPNDDTPWVGVPPFPEEPEPPVIP